MNDNAMSAGRERSTRAATAKPKVQRSRRVSWKTIVASILPALVAVPMFAFDGSKAVAQAPVGAGFAVTPADLAFILKQIKISENHAAALAATPPGAPIDLCVGLLSHPAGVVLPNPTQGPVATPLTSWGVRTVDGTCNNLQPGRHNFGAADQAFPRLTGAPSDPPASYPPGPGSFNDAHPRVVSNLIVDQTKTNPAAVASSNSSRRSQGGGTNYCLVPGGDQPDGCIDVPAGITTLDIPNITTDVGLSPPYNSLFTIFGQFFDHGLDFTEKTTDSVFIPLDSDDPLFGSVPPNRRFMVLDRTANMPGGVNRDSPYVDLSQNYSSHPSHQVFIREYVDNNAGRPVSTGKLLGLPDGGLPTWKIVKDEAAAKLGLQLRDGDVFEIPMIATDPYGKFIPGPARGLPQYVTDSGLIEGNRANGGVVPPLDVKTIKTAFLDDIAHHAKPSKNNALNPKAKDSDLAPNSPPGLGEPNTYDDETLDRHFIAGDGRVNENIGLTAVHSVFHSEHDRLVGQIKNLLNTLPAATRAEWEITAANGGGAGGWNGERLFQAARFITEMQYQHLAFEEFARKIQPLIPPFSVYHDNVDSAITAEFASAVYRFGHSMLTDTIPRIFESGAEVPELELFHAFLNPVEFHEGPGNIALTTQQATGAIIMGLSDQPGQELDEFVSDTLRNRLVGLPLDLATLNIARGRDARLPRLNEVRRRIFNATQESSMQPYEHWIDFGQHLKNPASLVNFLAAYGKHTSITDATTLAGKRAAAAALLDPPSDADEADVEAAFQFLTNTNTATTGVEDIDLWMGGLAERTNLFGGLLGSTFNYVFEKQMSDLQNGDRFYYLARTVGMNLRASLEGNSFSELAMRNSNAVGLNATDAFSTADCEFHVSWAKNPVNHRPAGRVADDPTTDCDESELILRTNGRIEYRVNNGVDPAGINGQSIFNGTNDPDNVKGGVDNDSLIGNDGDDRLEGNDGGDVAVGGNGNDVITDSAGDDVPKGGPGDDYIEAGVGLDIIHAGEGKDVTFGGLNHDETFAGPGDDFIHDGEDGGTVFGDSGSDWIEGGDGQELLCGDSCAPFFDDPNDPGNDVLNDQNGEGDYDAEGGDDVMVAGPGIERNAGAAGWDWITHYNDPLPASADLNLKILPNDGGLPGNVQRDRYQETEAISGWNLNDIIRGDSLVPSANDIAGGFAGNDVITAQTLQVFNGLAGVLPQTVVDAINGGTPWGAGNILLGGDGNDILEGRGADDIIDGDKYLRVRLSVRTNPADPATEIGTTDSMSGTFPALNGKPLQTAIKDRDILPSQLVAVREIVTTPAGPNNADTAVFSGPRADYTITPAPPLPPAPPTVVGTVTVTDNGHAADPAATPPLEARAATDGTDTLTNVECLQFSDVRVALTSACNRAPTGSITINVTGPPLAPLGAAQPEEDRSLTAVHNIVDPDGVSIPMVLTWYAAPSPSTAFAPVGTGPVFVPGDNQVGHRLMVVANYTDGLGFPEQRSSSVTGTVRNINDPATGVPSFTNQPQVGEIITALIEDVNDKDRFDPATVQYQWFANGAPVGTNSNNFEPTANLVGQALSVRVSFTDLHGTPESILSAATAGVLPAAMPPAQPAPPTATSLGFGAATVSWVAPFNGHAAIDHFEIEVLDGAGASLPLPTDPTVPWIVGTDDGDTTSTVITDLDTAGSFRFRVRAVNFAGTGDWSPNSVAITPQGNPTPPVIRTATGGTLTATVNWTPPTSNGGSPITNFVVRLRNAAGSQVVEATIAANLAATSTPPYSYTFGAAAGLSAGTGYTFVIDVYTANNGRSTSELSAPFEILAATVPGAPASALATGGLETAKIDWTAPTNTGGSPITGYAIDMVTPWTPPAIAPIPVNIYDGNNPNLFTYTHTTFSAAGGYTFQVYAKNAQGRSLAYSAAVTNVTAIQPPEAPTINSVNPGVTSATVNWTTAANTGGSGVALRDFTVAAFNGEGSQVGSITVNAPASSATVTGLTAANSYRFQVTARNTKPLSSPPSVVFGPVSTLPAPTAPAAPTIGAVNRGNASAVVNWTANGDGGAPITSFQVRAVNSAGTTITTNVPNPAAPNPPATSVNVTGLTNGTQYAFSVVAINGSGTSAPSAPVNAMPATVPTAPTITGSVRGGDGAPATVNLTWTAPANNGGEPITGYIITGRQYSGGGTASGPVFTAQVGNILTYQMGCCLGVNLTAGTAYRFQVRAINGVGNGALSALSARTSAR